MHAIEAPSGGPGTGWCKSSPVAASVGHAVEVRRADERRSLGTSFRHLSLAVVISGLGDGMFLTAFPLLAAALTRDAVLIAGVTVASRLPWLLFSLVAGAIADRVDRRRLMVFADISRCAVVTLLGVAVFAGDARVWLLYVCAFGLGIGE